MDARGRTREEEKQQLLQRLAELMVQEQCEQGVFDRVPHYSQLERAARSLGQELSCRAQQRAVAEAAALSEPTAACPGCGQLHAVEFHRRTVTSIDGPVEVVEPLAHCRQCRRSFFPSA